MAKHIVYKAIIDAVKKGTLKEPFSSYDFKGLVLTSEKEHTRRSFISIAKEILGAAASCLNWWILTISDLSDQLSMERTMAKPLDPKQIVSVQELAISNMLEIEPMRQLLFEKGILTKEEFIDRFKKIDREMKEKRQGKYFQDVLDNSRSPQIML